VQFEDKNQSFLDSSICFQTCSLVFPNTSLVLIAADEKDSGKLTCRCGLSNSVNSSLMGPGSVEKYLYNLSTSECEASEFRNMAKGWEKYYSTFVLRL